MEIIKTGEGGAGELLKGGGRVGNKTFINCFIGLYWEILTSAYVQDLDRLPAYDLRIAILIISIQHF